jgi:DNA-binding GntR family transcriptional regulator
VSTRAINAAGERMLVAISADAPLFVQAREAIRDAILVGTLVPGTLYSVRNLANMLNVSRTPVREALLDLAGDGLVRFERNRGVRVLESSVHDLQEIFTLRLLLEVPATYRAVEQSDERLARDLRRILERMEKAAANDDEHAFMAADRKFHSLILEGSGNKRLAAYVDQLRDLVLSRGASTVGRSRSLADIVDEHLAIIAEIELGNAAEAAAVMRKHLIRTGQLLIEQEGGNPEVLEAAWARIDD